MFVEDVEGSLKKRCSNDSKKIRKRQISLDSLVIDNYNQKSHYSAVAQW